MADEWFRSPAWGPADRAEFERRLARARPIKRGQYLRIKGLALEDAGHPDAARELWLRVLDEPGYPTERWSAIEHLADLAAAGDVPRAEALYRRLLAEDPTLNGTTGMAPVRLAALLIGKGTDAALSEAKALLADWDRSPFPTNVFEWEVTLVRWGEAARDPQVTRDAARRALALITARAPFPRHPGVGVVRTDAELTAWLRARADAS